MVHFQTDVGKIPLAPPPAAPPGHSRVLGGEYFFKICLKMDRIFKHLFENGPISKHLF